MAFGCDCPKCKRGESKSILSTVLDEARRSGCTPQQGLDAIDRTYAEAFPETLLPGDVRDFWTRFNGEPTWDKLYAFVSGGAFSLELKATLDLGLLESATEAMNAAVPEPVTVTGKAKPRTIH